MSVQSRSNLIIVGIVAGIIGLVLAVLSRNLTDGVIAAGLIATAVALRG